jgi:hypothetical protein
MEGLSSYDRRGSLDLLDEMRLTVQLADFSKGFAAEAVEGRCFISEFGTPYGELRAIAKPVIVEQAFATTAAANFIYVSIGPWALGTGVELATAKCDIGGIPTTMGWFRDAVDPLTTANTTIVFESWTFGEEFRAFVPPGNSFMLRGVAGQAVESRLLCREVADLPRTRG